MNGPEWLKTADLSGPKDIRVPEDCPAEMKADDAERAHGLLTAVGTLGIGQLMKVEDFSSVHRLFSTTAKVLKFCRLLLQPLRPGIISANLDDLAKAEVLWVRESQQVLMSDKNFTQWEKQLDLFRDGNGIWRCGGRIQNANFALLGQTPYSASQGSPFLYLACKKSPRESVPQWSEGNTDGAKVAVLDYPREKLCQTTPQKMYHL